MNTQDSTQRRDRIIWAVIIVIVILLTCIAIPGFVKARNTSSQQACLNNLRIIDEGKEQAAMAYRLTDGHATNATR